MVAGQPSKVAALAGLTLAMVLFGGTYAVTKVAAEELSPALLAFLRYVVAGAVLLPIALVGSRFAKLPQPIPWTRLTIMAGTGVALFTIAFNYALVFATSTQGAMIYALVPAATASVAWMLLKERQSRLRIVGMVTSLVGVSIVLLSAEQGGTASSPLLGGGLMLIAVATWAFYTVVAKQLAGVDQIAVITLVMLIGAAMLLPFAVIEAFTTPLQWPSLAGFGGLVFLGVVTSALVFILYNWSMRAVDATTAGIFANVDPVVGVLTGVLFLGETINALQIAGGAIVIVGVVVSTVRSS